MKWVERQTARFTTPILPSAGNLANQKDASLTRSGPLRAALTQNRAVPLRPRCGNPKCNEAHRVRSPFSAPTTLPRVKKPRVPASEASRNPAEPPLAAAFRSRFDPAVPLRVVPPEDAVGDEGVRTLAGMPRLLNSPGSKPVAFQQCHDPSVGRKCALHGHGGCPIVLGK